MNASESRHIFIVAGEHSGDLLGGKVMQALKKNSPYTLKFSGVGGETMEEQGLSSIFPMSDVAVMGPVDIAKALPRLVRRVYECVDAGVAAKPDLVLIIDSPEFTHPIAKRIRKAIPDCPIIDYVSPSVWAWRPGRARKMTPYVDHVLALLPFEPAAHKRLGGPECSYVGHPMLEKREWMLSRDVLALQEKLHIDADSKVLVVLPGSRTNEVKRLMKPFGETVDQIKNDLGELEVIIPVVPSVEHLVKEGLADWNLKPHLVYGEDDKFTSFKMANCALAASGTVTLELAMAGCPMVVGYKVDAFSALFRGLIQVPSIVLANLVLEENIFPEFIQERCTSENLVQAVMPLLSDTPVRQKQLDALETLTEKMLLPEGVDNRESPSEAAAQVVLDYLVGEKQIATRSTA